MFASFAKKGLRTQAAKPSDAQITAVYSALTSLARAPVFYTRFAIPDTTDGRYDMVCLALSLYLFRLQQALPAEAQALFDLAFKDAERGLREAGVGDLSVSKNMKKMLEAFYGRAALYYEALEQNDSASLAAVLIRNVYNGDAQTYAQHAAALAEWVRIAWHFLQAIAPQELWEQPNQLLDILPPEQQEAA